MFSMGVDIEVKSKKETPSFDFTDEQINQLRRLKSSYDEGLIDDEEYKTRKKGVLS